MTLALICAGWIAWAPVADPAPPLDLARSYQEARAQAGRSPEAQVRLALWCEAHGLTAERLHHLTLAVLAHPKNAAARGLMGLVSHNGRWQRPEAVADKARADATLSEYEAKRLKAAYTADAQWALGVWCDEHGLKEQAKAHLTAVIRLDPSRENAWKKLGYKRHEGRWATEAQLALEKADAEAQKAADRKWKPLLERSKAMLYQPSKREGAEAALANVTDPRAVPMIGRVFATAEATQPLAVQLLGQVDSPGASKALAYLAVFARSAEARRIATESLRGRDPREYANLLIAMIQKPIKYEVKSVGGPGSPGTLLVEGGRYNVQRRYSPPSAPNVLVRPYDQIGVDSNGLPAIETSIGLFSQEVSPQWGLSRSQAVAMARSEAFLAPFPESVASRSPVLQALNQYATKLESPGFVSSVRQIDQQLALTPRVPHSTVNAHHYLNLQMGYVVPVGQMMVEAQMSALAAQRQLADDVASLDRYNAVVNETNDRILQVLNPATGQNLPADLKKWNDWWVDQLGLRSLAITPDPLTKPTLTEEVPLSYLPQSGPSFVPISITTSTEYRRFSCFGAGTPVRTVDGVRPIESLKVGDLVLTQSTDSGALGYKPILVVHHNPPSATFRIKVGGEPIVSSHFHRFWVAGRGWVMARELKAGDPVRTLGGVSPVESVEADKVQLVYNLDVAEDADFFAGNVGALVHDNTLPDPRLTPFDAPSRSAGVAMAGRAE